MCKGNIECLSCINEKLDKLTLTIDEINLKLDRMDKLLNWNEGILSRVSYLEKLVTTSQWIAGILFTSVIGVVLKIMFKV